MSTTAALLMVHQLQSLHDRGDHAGVVALANQALAQHPQEARLWDLTAASALALGMQADAEQLWRTAVDVQPDYARGHYNLGVLLHRQQRYAEAELAYRRALQLDPRNAAALENLGMLMLATGRLEQGWPLLEARCAPQLGSLRVPLPPLPQPRWQGDSLQDRALLLWCEQGYGDSIQFCRYAVQLGAMRQTLGLLRLGLAAPAPLLRLMRSLPGIDEVLSQDAIIAGTETAAHYDCWDLLMSQAGRFGTRLDTIPAELPYLHADTDAVSRWRARLRDGSDAKLHVGLVWQGRIEPPHDPRRSLPSLRTLAPLWNARRDCRFHSLQLGEAAAEIPALAAAQPIDDIAHELHDFAETAAALCALDLLICVDTAITHLAGALARPVWLLLSTHGSDWRWAGDGEHSPWYPQVLRRFRQAEPQNWQAPVQAAAQALARFGA